MLLLQAYLSDSNPEYLMAVETLFTKGAIFYVHNVP